MKKKSLSVVLNEQLGKDNLEQSELNGYGVQYTDGTIKCHPFQICCSKVKGLNSPKGFKEFVFSVRHRKNWTDHPRWNEFLHFMLNYSFIKDVFLTKNVGNANRYGIKMNLDWDSNYVLGGFFFLRCAWEYEYYLKSFFRLVDAGIDKNLALLCCQYILFNTTSKGIEYVYPGQGTGHTPFYSLSKERCLELYTKPLQNDSKFPLKKGSFLLFAVNKTLDKAVRIYGDNTPFFIFNGVKQTLKIRNEWGDYINYYNPKVIIDKVKEFQQSCQK